MLSTSASLSEILTVARGIKDDVKIEQAFVDSLQSARPEFFRLSPDQQLDFLMQVPDFVKRSFLNGDEGEISRDQLVEPAEKRLTALHAQQDPDSTIDSILGVVETLSILFNETDYPSGKRVIALVGSIVESLPLSVLVTHTDRIMDAISYDEIFDVAARRSPASMARIINEMEQTQLPPEARASVVRFLAWDYSAQEAGARVAETLKLLSADQRRNLLVAHLEDIMDGEAIAHFPANPADLRGDEHDFLNPLAAHGVTIEEVTEAFRTLHESRIGLTEWPFAKSSDHRGPRQLAEALSVDFMAILPTLAHVFQCSTEDIMRLNGAQVLARNFLDQAADAYAHGHTHINSYDLNEAVMEALPVIKFLVNEAPKHRNTAV